MSITQRHEPPRTPVALLLADQRMPEMEGTDFLAAARQLFPEAKRVLLTAYADTDAAIQAINEVDLDYYLMKPWDPPEDKLFPVLDDLINDWKANVPAPFDGIRVLGTAWSPSTHETKDFLARNQIPYRFLDIERDADAAAIVGEGSMPVAMLPDGSRLEQPDKAVLAEKVGLRTQAEQPFYDLIIIGGGPAGLAGAVYGASEGLRTAMIERDAPGGQPVPVAGSRTTSGSRPESAAVIWPAGRPPRRPDLARNYSPRSRPSRSKWRTRSRSSSSRTAQIYAATPCCWPAE